MEIIYVSAVVILGIAFFCEYVDSTLGMGYGTTLTPLLLIMGYSPLQIVPAVLFSELISGLLAGVLHHSHGNVDFGLRKVHLGEAMKGGRSWRERILSVRLSLPLHLKVALALALCSIAGTTAAVFVAISIPKFWLKLYIGVLVFSMGVVIVLCRRREFRFSWRKVVLLGSVAAFNKGMSGGGYGPVVTSGQILSGVDGRSAVGITSLAEGLTCLTGLSIYFLLDKAPLDWSFAMLVAGGAVLSVPFSARSVRCLKVEFLKNAIAGMTLVLGGISIVTTLLNAGS